MTFAAQFQTADLSDFFAFTFRGFLMKGDGGDGQIIDIAKGTNRHKEDKSKGRGVSGGGGGGGHQWRRQMKGWRDGGFFFSLFH